jgi:GT2 family glycosyltransferase
MSRARDWPIAVRTVDIARPLAPLEGMAPYPRARVFVTDGGELVGAVDIAHAGAPTIPAARLRQAIAEWLGHRLFTRDIARQLERGTAADRRKRLPRSVSIVIPTCDRPDDLRRCLASVTAQSTAFELDVIVVDNRPGAAATREVVRDFPSARLVAESRPGLSYARNTGIAAARGEIIVATDDDVTAPPDWIARLVAPFERPEVAAVTGQVLPLELETESQCRFEAYGGLGKGFDPREANGDWFRGRRTAVPTWELGATANAAFRASIFRDSRIGLLDDALGAGMPTGCSEDTYLFYRILKAGHTIVYEPSAYVRHRHRDSMASLRHQILAYSRGHVAYHLTTLLRDGDRRALVRLFYSLPRTYARRAWQRLRGRSDYPLSLILLEIRGNLAGPWALWRSRRRVRELGPSTPLPATGPEDTTHAVPVEGAVAEDPQAEPAVAPLARATR